MSLKKKCNGFPKDFASSTVFNISKLMSGVAVSDVSALEETLCKGLLRLLDEARLLKITRQPFGRIAEPNPLISEESFLQTREHVSDLTGEPVFRFEYGFNPLAFLGKYLKWSHPASIAARKDAKFRAATRLRKRAQHALKQLETTSALGDLARTQASGVVWGPFVGPLQSSSVIIVAQGLYSGTLVFQLATDCEFVSIVQTLRERAEVHIPSKVTVDNLISGTKYFVRCCLEQGSVGLQTTEGTSNAFTGPEMGRFQCSSFFTIPSNKMETTDDSGVEAAYEGINITIVPANLLQNKDFTFDLDYNLTDSSSEFTLTGFVGDVFSGISEESSELDYSSHAWKIFSQSNLMKSRQSLARKSLFVIGWNDGRFGSEVDVKSEEVTYKQYAQDLKRYAKKYGQLGNSKAKTTNATKVPPPEPVFTRPPPSVSFTSLLNGFPLRHKESATRNFYRSLSVGSSMELFLLDTRNGYLGREQSKWLKESLADSRAKWKLVLGGLPIAISQKPDSDSKTRPVSRDRSSVLAVMSANETSGEGSTQKVHVQVPESCENDVDEFGRSKFSLQYLIFSLQRSRNRENALMESTNDEVSSVDLSSNIPISKNESVDDFEDPPMQDSDFIESGIIFVTTDSASINDFGRSFVATFDPNQTGRAFCAEVKVGSYISTPKGSSSLRVSPHMETRFLYGGETVLREPHNESKEHICSVRLAEDGTLSTQIHVSAGVNSEMSLVYERKFECYCDSGQI